MTVRYEVERGIATITLDSPGNRNALSNAVRTGLADGLAAARDDGSVRAVVVTGTGPVFCAGADLKEVASGAAPEGPGMPEILNAILDLGKPVIAHLNGPARAGGLGIVAACDMAFAGDDVTFAFTEVRIGVVPAMIAVVCRERMTPRALTRYFLTGETFPATEAVASGLLTATVPAADLDALVGGVLEGLRLTEPRAVARTKRLLDELPDLDRGDAFPLAERISREFFDSPEAAEGRMAFFAKRPPNWAS